MKNKFEFFLALTLIYALIIFYLSSRSDIGDPRDLFGFFSHQQIKNIISTFRQYDLEFLLYPLVIFSAYPDKVAHFFLYAGFGLFLYLTLRNSSNPVENPFIYAIVLGILYGATDEIHQSFVPGRSSSLGDLFADSLGLIIMQTVIFIKDKLTSRT